MVKPHPILSSLRSERKAQIHFPHLKKRKQGKKYEEEKKKEKKKIKKEKKQEGEGGRGETEKRIGLS